MKEMPSMGVNRTGVQMSPLETSAMRDMVSAPATDSMDETEGMATLRAAYALQAEPLGSVPIPGSVKGVVATGAALLTGNQPQLLIDKLGERLAFERTGTRLYEALIMKVEALQQGSTGVVPLEALRSIRDDEARHFALVAQAVQDIGADPTAETPCADVAGVEASGLLKVVSDARTTIAQSLHAVLVAEMADNSGWELLIALARDQGQQSMADGFVEALRQEQQHLAQVQAWFEELTLGAALPPHAVGGAIEAAGGALH